MKEVIILTPGPFLKRDYERFGIELLKKNFLIKILDITAWIKPQLWQEYSNKVYKCEEYIAITSENSFLNSISQINSPIVLDRLAINNKTNWMRKILRENRVGDHIWYISDMKKFKKKYPKWKQKYSTSKIIE